MPAEFEHPLLWGTVDFWRPIAFTPEQRQNRGNNYLRAFARLKPGVDIDSAQQSMMTLAANLSRETSSNQNDSLRLAPLQRSSSNDVSRSVMWFTFGLAGVVLLIACANLANLQLVRSARTRARAQRPRGARSTPFAPAAAVDDREHDARGAGRLPESAARVRRDRVHQPQPLRISSRRCSDGGFHASSGLRCWRSVVTGIAFGTMPAWLASRTDVNHALKESPRGSTSGAHHRLRHALIVGEVAFAVILLDRRRTLPARAAAIREPRSRVALGRVADRAAQPAEQPLRDASNSEESFTSNWRNDCVPSRASSKSRSPTRCRSGASTAAAASSSRVSPSRNRASFPKVFFEQVSSGYFDTLGLTADVRSHVPIDRRVRALQMSSSSTTRWRAASGPTRTLWANASAARSTANL